MTKADTLIQILANELTRDDIHAMTYVDLNHLQWLLHHWSEIAAAELARRAGPAS